MAFDRRMIRDILAQPLLESYFKADTSQLPRTCLSCLLSSAMRSGCLTTSRMCIAKIVEIEFAYRRQTNVT